MMGKFYSSTKIIKLTHYHSLLPKVVRQKRIINVVVHRAAVAATADWVAHKERPIFLTALEAGRLSPGSRHGWVSILSGSQASLSILCGALSGGH